MNKSVLTLIAFVWLSNQATAQLALDAATAWKQVETAYEPPAPSPEWKKRLPTQAELQRHRQAEAMAAIRAANLADLFIKNFPANTKVNLARQRCHGWLTDALRRGALGEIKRLRRIEKDLLADTEMSIDERFRIRAAAVEREAAVAAAERKNAQIAYEQGLRELQRDFPKRQEVFQMFHTLALRSSPEKAAELAHDIITGSTSEKLRASAEAMINRAQRIGKPLRVKFKGIEGREIDTAKLKGKVIVLHFWATWAASAIADLDRLRELELKHAGRGLILLGISVDREKSALAGFVDYKNISWPQFFDEANKENRIATTLGITSIPAIWLIDKKGIVRDTNASSNLERAVAELLAEADKPQ